MHSTKPPWSRLAYAAITLLCVSVPLQSAVAAPNAARRQSSPGPATLHSHLRGPIQLVASLGTVTSILRSVEHNKRVGGVPNSFHLAGYAFDVRRNAGVTHQAIEELLRRAGYSPHESLDEVDHSHFAFLPASPLQASEQPMPADARIPQQKATAPALVADEHGVLSLQVGELLSSGTRP